MNLYKVGEQQFAVIDGELYVKVKPSSGEDAAENAPEEESAPAPKRKAKGKHKGRKLLTEQQEQEITERFQSAESVADIAEAMGLSYGTIAKRHIKFTQDSKSTKNNAVKSYVCFNGHEFSSKLSELDVICPVCHSTDCDLGTLNGEVQEGEV